MSRMNQEVVRSDLSIDAQCLTWHNLLIIFPVSLSLTLNRVLGTESDASSNAFENSPHETCVDRVESSLESSPRH